ncbi:16815_t:CDS:2, partial [Dentiscutata erythropus]
TVSQIISKTLEQLEKVIADENINCLDYERFTECKKIGSGSFGEGAQQNDLENSWGEMLAQIGELKKPVLSRSDEMEMDYEKREGDVEKVVIDFLTSKDKLTSVDKLILETEANEFLILKEITLLINKVNSFFKPENQLTLEDIDILNAAANEFLILKDKKTSNLLEMVLNEFLSSPEEKLLKNIFCNLLESLFVFENKLSLKSKSNLDLARQITLEDAEALKKASKDKKDLKQAVNEFLTLKAKEVLETAVNNLKYKKVLLLLGSEGTEKLTFNCYLAHCLWDKVEKDLIQLIPLFIALAPLKEFINKDQDFIEVYLQEKRKLSEDQIKELRNRKFKNAKIIISCQPEYLDIGYGERFWPKENGKRGFQELTFTPFSDAEIKKYIIKYFNYSQKGVNPLPWNADTYIKQIEDILQVKDLVYNLILLKISMTVLPGLLKEIGTTSQINEEQKSFDNLNKEGFTNHCLQFGKKFAFEMFVDNNKVVVNYDQETQMKKCRLMHFSMPLFQRGNQYWFFHKSLRDYLIACTLLDSFKDTSQEIFSTSGQLYQNLQFNNFWLNEFNKYQSAYNRY